MGTLSKRNRTNLVAILYAVITYNFDNLVYEFLDVAEYDTIPDHEELIRDIKDAISPFIGLSVKETNMSELVRGLITTLSKHELYLQENGSSFLGPHDSRWSGEIRWT